MKRKLPNDPQLQAVESLKLYTIDELEDEIIGKIGTPERDIYERKLKIELARDAKKQRI